MRFRGPRFAARFFLIFLEEKNSEEVGSPLAISLTRSRLPGRRFRAQLFIRIPPASQYFGSLLPNFFGGKKFGRGRIRTHEPFRVSCFQDRRNRPLCHSSKNEKASLLRMMKNLQGNCARKRTSFSVKNRMSEMS